MTKHSATLTSLCCPNRPHLSLGLCTTCYQRYKKYQRGGCSIEGHEHLIDIVKSHPDRKTKLIQKRQIAKKKRRAAREKVSGHTRDYWLRRRYGITADAFDLMLVSQGGGCRVCNKRPGKRAFYVDHNHETGAIRGIVCPRCNTFIGFIEKYRNLVEIIDEYLEDDRP